MRGFPGRPDLKVVPTLEGGQEVLEMIPGVLFVCEACCCGNGYTYPKVDKAHYLREARRRGISEHVSIVFTADDGGGCLGPCGLGNNAFLYLYGKGLWFQRMNGKADIDELYGYLEESIRIGQPAPIEGKLADRVYTKVQGEQIPVAAT
jgi:hypothetical protein